MTELVYLRDSYVRECDAAVTGTDGQAVALDVDFRTSMLIADAA